MPEHIFFKELAFTYNKIYNVRFAEQLFKQHLIFYDIYRKAPPLWLNIVSSLIASQRLRAP